MPEVKARRRKKARFPNFNGMREMHCAKDRCGAFLGYELINLGLVEVKCHQHACKNVTQVSAGLSDVAPPDKLTEARCGACGRFLYGEAIIDGRVRVKCRGCGEWNTLEISP